jgi:hypothetical protein
MRLSVGFLVCLAFAGCSSKEPSSPAVETVDFTVIGSLTRATTRLAIAVTNGDCGTGTSETKDRWAGSRVATTRDAYIVSAFAHPFDGVCAGVGLDPFHESVPLPGPIGGRALIADGGPYDFSVILIPPSDRAAVRRLVSHTGHAATLYDSNVCDRVANAFRGVPKDRWCSSR